MIPVDDVPAHIHALKPDWETAAISSVSYLSGGYSNHNYKFVYRDQTFVIRIPFAQQPFVSREHEAAYLAEMHAGVLRIIAYDIPTGRMITPWIDGHLLAAVYDDMVTRPQITNEALAHYLWHLHEQMHPPQRTYDIVDLLGLYLGRCPTVLATRLNAWPSLELPCHNDLNPWNIIVNPTEWTTLDWEFAANNHPWFDLVSLHHGLEKNTDELDHLAHLYLKHVPEDDPRKVWLGVNLQESLELARIAFCAREWAWAEYQCRQGNDREEIVDQAQTYRDKLITLVGTLN